jgi:hypothetical protein
LTFSSKYVKLAIRYVYQFKGIKMAYKDYTLEDIKNLVPKVTSMSQLIVALGKKPAGGNFMNMKVKLKELEGQIDTSHWTGQAWSKDKQLKDYKEYSRGSRLKPHLIKERGNTCEICSLSVWLDFPIMIEIHHLDGDRANNKKENLQLLCPNCHSTTDNWRNRKRE